jgi:hypothetical protein
MKEIPLTRGQFAIVDDELFDDLSRQRWQAQWHTCINSYYASHQFPQDNGKRPRVTMHRYITGAPEGTCVDHINGNTLDNRVENLRLVTARQNCQNRHTEKSSIYPGVTRLRRCNRWQSAIRIDGQKVYLGIYADETDAFKAYILACEESGFETKLMLDKFCIINVTKVQSLLEPWYVEQILDERMGKG